MCPHKVKGQFILRLANIKFLGQQDFGTYYEEHHQTYSRGEIKISLSYMYECREHNIKAEHLFH